MTYFFFPLRGDLALGKAAQKADINLSAIKIVQRLEKEQRDPTPDEQDVLSNYTGWGDSKVFDHGMEELEQLVSEKEYRSIKASTLNAHFTALPIIRAIWSGVMHLGADKLTSLHALDPAAGVGHFFSLLPEVLREKSHLVEIELDHSTARILKYLHPNQEGRSATFNDGFQSVPLNAGQFDLVISNVPFGNYPVVDPSIKEHFLKSCIHDYFFAKAVSMTRPGGVIAFITSRYTLDKKKKNFREWLARRANLLCAVRLPNTAFLGNAGTEVVTDIVFLQKRLDLLEGALPSWVETQETKLESGYIENHDERDGKAHQNLIYSEHPDWIIGKVEFKHGLYNNFQYTVKYDGSEQIADLVVEILEDALPEDVLLTENKKPTAFETVLDTLTETHVIEIHKDAPIDQVRRLEILRDIYDAAQTLLNMEVSGRNDVEGQRAKLNTVYDSFVSRFGPITNSLNQKLLKDSPARPFLLALETDYVPLTNSADKAPIFHTSTVRSARQPEKIDNCVDAFLYSLDKTGGVDIDWIASLAKVSVEQAVSELAGKILWTPDDHWEIAEKYLSGNLLEKLSRLNTMVTMDPRLKETIRVVKEALPPPLKPEEIKARLGSGWIPADMIEEYIEHILPGTSPQVTHIPKVGMWKVTPNKYHLPAENTTKWGTPRAPAFDLLEYGLNAQTPVIYDEDEAGKRHLNREQTIAAQAKLEELKADFVTWLWMDEERAKALAIIYNEKFNGFVRPTYDGSHLSFPGLSLEVTPRQLQKDAVWYALQRSGTLVGDEVGAGKTLTAILSVMESIRLGFAHKAMFVVPNHLTEQWFAEIIAAYPNAKVLCIGKEEMSKANRSHYMSRIATHNWDAVIVPQSSFKLLPLKPETLAEFVEAELEELRSFLIELKSEERRDRRAEKEIEKAIKRFEAKLAEKADMAKDSADTITWEQLGIDMLVVDEFHCLPYEARVLTDRGLIPIGEIVNKRLPVRVKSVDLSAKKVKWMPVTGWFNNPQSAPMVRVVHEQGVLKCTANHRIWTEEEGYVEAGKLTKEHTLKNLPNMQKRICFESTGQGWTKAGALFPRVPKERRTQNSDKTLPAMWRGIHVPLIGPKEQRQEKVLWNFLCRQVANGTTGTQGTDEGIYASGVGGVTSGSQRQTQSSGISPHEGEQSKSNYRMEEEDVENHVRSHLSCAGWQWDIDPTAEGGGERAGIADGICHPHQAGEGPIQVPAHQLQGGHCRPGAQAGDRDRWSNAQHEEVEVPGQAEDRGVERSRVVRVAFLESESGFRSGFGARRDQRVYCLEVAGTHNFFAEGVLVSNCYKNLYFHTKMTRVAGLPNANSQRAFDMFIKIRLLLQNDCRFIGLTGTPLTNTLAEVFTLQRYFQFDLLDRIGLSHFDSWVQMFADTVMVPEMTPDGGGFRVNTRLARFTNIPELSGMMAQFMIMRRWDDISDQVVRPVFYGGKPVPVQMPGSKALKGFVKTLSDRYEKVKAGGVDPREDNVLKIMSEGRKAALDMRLLFPNAYDLGASKINTASWIISELYHRTEPHKSAQLVFCDLGTPKPYQDSRSLKDSEDGTDLTRAQEDEPEFNNVYADLKAKLVRRGVRGSEIAFIHDVKKPADRARLFENIRRGNIRVLIGSTEKMGTGMNVQTRAIAMHHLDAPWRPADIEQRDGRVLRQGNIYSEVFSFVYITEGSFDGYVWQILETKARFIEQFLKGNTGTREMDDVGDTVLSMAELKALASGNPKIVERVLVQSEIMKLENLRSAWQSGRWDTQRRFSMNTTELKETRTRVGFLTKALDLHTKASPDDKFAMEVEGSLFTERRPAGAALIEAARILKLEAERTGREARKKTGEYRGFAVWLRAIPNSERSMNSLMSEVGVDILLDYNVPQVLVARVSDSDTGTIASIDATIRSVEGEIKKNVERIEYLETQVRKFESILSEEWEHAEKLAALVVKLNLMDQELIKDGEKTGDANSPTDEEADGIEEITTAPVTMETQVEPDWDVRLAEDAVVNFNLDEILEHVGVLIASTVPPDASPIAVQSVESEPEAVFPVSVSSQKQLPIDEVIKGGQIHQSVQKPSKSKVRKKDAVPVDTVQLTFF